MITMTVYSAGLHEMEAGLAAMEAEIPLMTRREQLATAFAAERLITPLIRDETPVVTAKLAQSTQGRVLLDGEMVVFSQPAETEPSLWDGSGGGEKYVQWVVGGRGPVYPVNKKALAGPNFGPVKYAGPAAPNPYPDRAMRRAATPLSFLLAATGRRMSAHLMTVL